MKKTMYVVAISMLFLTACKNKKKQTNATQIHSGMQMHNSSMPMNHGMVTTGSTQTKWVAPSSAKTIKGPLKMEANDVKAGEALFTQTCVICHGIKGEGNGMAGAALIPKPANLTLNSVQSQTDGELFWKITNGNPPMSAYKDILTETQRWQLVAYLRTFKK
jgi:mono/diheme cytochrome c family protein